MMNRIVFIVLCAVSCAQAVTIPKPAWPLRVKTIDVAPKVRKAYLEDQQGTPFFYNADTCWFLTFEATDEEVVAYFEDRAAKGITVVQCMILPWVREGDNTWFGEFPFEDNKFDRPNEAFFKHVDFVVDAAHAHNITLSMGLVWSGCCGEGWTQILNSSHNTQNDYAALKEYACFIGKRYGDAGNVTLFLGGDSSENRTQFTKMAETIKEVTPKMLIAHHPSSWFGPEETFGIKSSTSKDEHAQGDYLDISWTYTYWPGQNNRAHSHSYYLNHMEWNRNQNVPTETSRARPFLLGEAGYENERGSKVRRIRRFMHWNFICGAIGHAFGNGSIWGLENDWQDQLDSPGSVALGHMLDIYGARSWWQLVPEQPKDEYFQGAPFRIAGAETFILSGQEMYDNVLSLDEKRGEKFVAAAKTPDGKLVMAYFPHYYSKQGIEIDMTKLSEPVVGKWIDPQSAKETVVEGSPFSNAGSHAFTPPGKNSFGDKDWVLVLEAKERPFKYEVSWLGNSFSGADNKWVQNFFIHMNVRPDGSCVTWSHWDEGGKKFGIYKDGDVIGNEDVGANSLEVKDKQGRQWKLHVTLTDPKHNEWDFTPERITCDGREVSFPDLHCPTALAVDNNGWLMVADSWISPRQQILFYDVTDLRQPQLKRTFGDYGGISSDVPGQVTPTKLWGIRGMGVDAEDNIYVAMHEMGSVLRKFTRDGKLIWELFDHFFVDVASADCTTDAVDVWGIQEHYKLDWSKAPGQESTWVGYSLDRVKYPNDPRGLSFVKQQGEHGLTSPQIVYIEDKRFMFVGGMFASNFINIFRYEGEMAIPSGLIMQWQHGLYRTDLKWPPHRPKGTFIWRDKNGDGNYQADEYDANADCIKPGPFWVDKKGNIWMAYGFFRYDCQGIDEQGNPVYKADKVTLLDVPEGIVGKIARVCYLDETDTLVVAQEGSDMRHISRVFVCQDYLAGNRKTVSFVPGAGPEAGCVAAVGDYAFTGGWKERGRIWVNRLSDGKEMGVFDPGPTVGGVETTGWIDIFTGITAHRREDGEYLVFVEDDGRAKVIVYRWRP